MKRIRWVCAECGAIHHYIPTKCSRCGENVSHQELRQPPGPSKDNQGETTFDTLMEELEDDK